jgi:hypothetical protein
MPVTNYACRVRIHVSQHHCRACGKIFCAKCSAKEARVRWYEEPERVCDTCYLYTKGA